MNDLVGNVFGKWTVLAEKGRLTNRGEKTYLCLCECGTKKILRGTILRSRKTTQCKQCFVSSLNKRPDLVGEKFGTWLVQSRVKDLKRNEWYYLCICQCGVKRLIPGYRLQSGDTNGCRKCRWNKDRAEYMGTFQVWRAMIARCVNKNMKTYYWYGARGIEVCERWLSFDNFVQDMGFKPATLQIDRIDNDGNYEPGNCRWVTAQINSLNKKREKKRS